MTTHQQYEPLRLLNRPTGEKTGKVAWNGAEHTVKVEGVNGGRNYHVYVTNPRVFAPVGRIDKRGVGRWEIRQLDGLLTPGQRFNGTLEYAAERLVLSFLQAQEYATQKAERDARLAALPVNIDRVKELLHQFDYIVIPALDVEDAVQVYFDHNQKRVVVTATGEVTVCGGADEILDHLAVISEFSGDPAKAAADVAVRYLRVIEIRAAAQRLQALLDDYYPGDVEHFTVKQIRQPLDILAADSGTFNSLFDERHVHANEVSS